MTDLFSLEATLLIVACCALSAWGYIFIHQRALRRHETRWFQKVYKHLPASIPHPPKPLIKPIFVPAMAVWQDKQLIAVEAYSVTAPLEAPSIDRPITEIYFGKDGLGRAIACKITNTREPDGQTRMRPQTVRIMNEDEAWCLANGDPFTPKLLGTYTFADGAHCIVMERLPGITLGRTALLPLTPHTQFRIAQELLRAVIYFHGRLHTKINDMKPSNVMVDGVGENGHVQPSFRVWLIDFNLAHTPESVPKRHGGTLLYNPPEIVRDSANIDPVLADEFSLGVTLFEMMAGIHFLPHDAPVRHICEQLGGNTYFRLVQPPLPRRVHAGLYDIVTRMMRPDPQQRFPSLLDALRALERLDPFDPD